MLLSLVRLVRRVFAPHTFDYNQGAIGKIFDMSE